MKKILLGISSGVIYTLLNVGISLLTAPYFLKFLSKEEFGIFYLANNLIIWAGLLNVGLRGSFKLQLASALGKGEATDGLTSTSFFTQCLVASIVFLIGLSFSFFLGSFFDLSYVSTTTAQHIFILLSFSFGFTLISNSLAAILSVHNKDLQVYISRSVFTALQAILSIILLWLHWGILGMALAALVVELFFLLYVYILAVLKFRLTSLRFSSFDRALLKSSFAIGKWFLLGFLAQLLIRHSDLFLIGKLSGVDTVTCFIISSKMYLLATGLLLMILKIITPQLVLRTQSHKEDLIHQMNFLFLKFIVGISTIAGIGIFLFNERFVAWWVGSTYYLGNYINLMLLIAFLFASYTNAARTLLLAKSELKSQKISALAEGILHLFLSALLGFYFEMAGIAGGIALSSILSAVITFPSLFKGPSYSTIGKREGSLLLIYVFIALTILLSFYVSPSFFGKEVIAFGLVSAAFLLLFLKDIRMVATKILRSH